MISAFMRYDIRGSYPDEINETFAMMLGSAYGKHNSIVIGGDLRKTTPFLKNAFLYGLDAKEVYDIGIASSDMVAFCSKELNANGVVITASHNPWSFNGFKFINPSSAPYTNEQLNEIKRRFGEVKGIERKDKQYLTYFYDCYDAYFNNVNEMVGKDYGDFSFYAVNSAALPSLRYAKRNGLLNIKVIGSEYVLNESYPSNPTLEYVKSLGIEKGVVLDGDADRGVIVDEGKVINAHYLIYGFAMALNAKTIVVSVDFSEILKKRLQEQGIKVITTRVGDVFVSNECLSHNCDFFAEPNNHFGFPSFSYYASGILAGMYYYAYNVRDHLPNEEILFWSDSFYVDDGKYDELLQKLKERKDINVINDIDGMKFEYLSSYILLRSSGTSKGKVRIYVESNKDDAKKIGERFIKEVIK